MRKVLVIYDGWSAWWYFGWKLLWPGFRAITINGKVYIKDKCLCKMKGSQFCVLCMSDKNYDHEVYFSSKDGNVPRIIKHEFHHAYQQCQYGSTRFLFKYVWQWIKAGFRYREIEFEKEAREAENR